MPVDSGGPFSLGSFPEDFGPEEPDPEQPARGWLPPEDRLWRHPSELRSSPTTSPEPGSSRSGMRWTLLAAGALSVVVATTVAAVVTGDRSTNLTATDTSVAVGPDVVKVVEAVEDSLVSLIPSGRSHPAAHATGVVLPSGDLVVTAASAVHEGEHLSVVSANGQRQTGTVEGVDDLAGVAVVWVHEKLVPGSFADEPVSPEQLAVAACRCNSGVSQATADPPPDVALGMVRAEGTQAVDSGGPPVLDAIEVEMPLGASALGSVLLDDAGGVIGVLDGERNVGGATVGYFVPTSLAVAVADELAHDHSVSAGWLGVVCQDEAGGGAMVLEVLPGSPAATAGLEPGDVVEAVDSHLVSSLADLQARLYVASPGTSLVLTVLRAGTVKTMPVTVAAKPS